MKTAIVVTNFSDSSRNALDYTCAFIGKTGIRILLLNIYSFPAVLASDALSVAAISETIAADEKLLKKEYEWVKETYANVNIETAMLPGNFMNELHEIANDEDVVLIVLGAGGKYNELLSWDANIINAFVDLKTPVLIIPSTAKFHPIKKVAFACNYFRKDLETPVSFIHRLIHFTNAGLYIIQVSNPVEIINEDAEDNKRILQQSLTDLNPEYFEPQFNNIIKAIDNFIAEENIGTLIVIPSRHGIWHNIFQQQSTKALHYLNHIPLLSLHRRGDFI